METARLFYEKAYRGETYAPTGAAESHPFYKALKTFIETYNLVDKLCLEVGTGRGAFQHLASNYIGIDLT